MDHPLSDPIWTKANNYSEVNIALVITSMYINAFSFQIYHKFAITWLEVYIATELSDSKTEEHFFRIWKKVNKQTKLAWQSCWNWGNFFWINKYALPIAALILPSAEQTECEIQLLITGNYETSANFLNHSICKSNAEKWLIRGAYRNVDKTLCTIYNLKLHLSIRNCILKLNSQSDSWKISLLKHLLKARLRYIINNYRVIIHKGRQLRHCTPARG